MLSLLFILALCLILATGPSASPFTGGEVLLLERGQGVRGWFGGDDVVPYYSFRSGIGAGDAGRIGDEDVEEDLFGVPVE